MTILADLTCLLLTVLSIYLQAPMQDYFLKLGASQSCELCTTTIAPYTTNMLRELLA